ncbi:LLM class flavin-dependent oxidoreductase [Tanticharoenia sakaeratensis]|jgi:N-acetyl-S-(2-succino)cysteine monooxygenase|uniref:Nitrilotriacetate monooxygenase component A n=1 Tax=Tanticharoenia sakaeratensis NBRC 103193 TaxID=1231623 RepID=A0A0D6MQA7_9PROT|nr:LLM class flavin-dependent oxidoreductase [Tanticharoenia sakaeratensis]GAN55641.1 nitrilotriacetate monooxygenase component A [Tanticharoenia sakaeratensis NBRC 103193]
MARTSKHMVLGGLFEANGYHSAAWLLPSAQDDAATDVGYFRRIIQQAEAGKLDFFFLADTPAARTENLDFWTRSPLYMNMMEPITLLSALAGSTKHIGLGATASTSFYEPYNIARLFGSLDHISGGRAAWNVVTSANDYAARNFGLDSLPPHDKRYEKAAESLEVVQALWDTWEDDAFIFDKANARMFEPARFHKLDHEGQFFRVQGGLNMRRSRQGQPVIFQAGASPAGKEFAARTAEVVFGTGATLAEAQAFYRDLKGRMAQYGRTTDQLKVLSGVSIVYGETRAIAEEKWARWQETVPVEVGLMYMKTDLETDLSDLPLDEPVPEHRIPSHSNFHQVYFNEIVGLIREGLTLRQICRKYNRSKVIFFGNEVDIADQMQEWVEQEGSDGFMMALPVLPESLTDVTEKVVPELQRRGLFRKEYEGTTLRENLGLAFPRNRYTEG